MIKKRKVERVKRIKTLSLFLIFLALTSLGTSFAGGDGTPASPYEIDRCRYLQDITDEMGAHYQLTADLDCSETSTWNSGNGFATLGAYSEDNPDVNSGFTGSLDGNGHTISGLFIDRSEARYLGLFSYVKNEGVIKDLNLQEVDITGQKYLGGIAGRNNGKLIDVSVSGNIRGEEYVGGVVGDNNGFVTNSYSMGRVNSEDKAAGGIAGWNTGDIYLSYSTASVNGRMSGGITAMNLGKVARSFSTGTIEGDRAGGIAGGNGYSIQLEIDGEPGAWIQRGGEIINSYSSATIDGSYSGGVVAVNNGSIQNSYARGAIYGAEADAGGLVGENHGSDNIQASYYDEMSTGYTRSDGGADLLTVDMKKKSSFEGWDFETNWNMPENGYPQLNVNQYKAVKSDGNIDVMSSEANISKGLNAVEEWRGDLTGFRVSDIGEDVVYVSTVSGDSIEVTGTLNNNRPENISFSIRPDSGCEKDSCRSISFRNQDGGKVFEITTEARHVDCGWGCSTTESGYSFNGEYSDDDRESWTRFTLEGINYDENKVSEVRIGDSVLATDVQMNGNASNITEIRLNSESKTGGLYLKELKLQGEAEKEAKLPPQAPSDIGKQTEEAVEDFENSINEQLVEEGSYKLSDLSYSGENSLRLISDQKTTIKTGNSVGEAQKVSFWVAANRPDTVKRGVRLNGENQASVYLENGFIRYEGSQAEKTDLRTYETSQWYNLEIHVFREGNALIKVKDQDQQLLAEQHVKISSGSDFSEIEFYSEKSPQPGYTWFDGLDISEIEIQEREDEEEQKEGEDEAQEEDSGNNRDTDDSQGDSEDENDQGEGEQDTSDEDSEGIVSGLVGFLKATFS